MKIYLAAMWSERDRMLGEAQFLEARGHVVTSRWIHSCLSTDAENAQMDLDDVRAADILILYSAGPRGTMFSGGGRQIEFGYALALGMRVILIGAVETCFHNLPQVTHFKTLEEFTIHARN